MSRETDEILDHSYDGIQEYDNPLPRWWLILFYLSIVFAIVYVPWFYWGPGQMPEAEYAAEMEAAGGLAPKRVTFERAEVAAAQTDDRVAAGKALYAKHCVACHTPAGGGSVGPNLTDEFWIHGGAPEAIAAVIANGVPEKGMIAWKSQLSRDEMISLSVFVGSLQGTNPPNPKAPRGEKYVPTEPGAAPDQPKKAPAEPSGDR